MHRNCHDDLMKEEIEKVFNEEFLWMDLIPSTLALILYDWIVDDFRCEYMHSFYKKFVDNINQVEDIYVHSVIKILNKYVYYFFSKEDEDESDQYRDKLMDLSNTDNFYLLLEIFYYYVN